MARHADPDPWPFYRSLMVTGARWLAVAALAVGVAIGLIAAIAAGDSDRDVVLEPAPPTDEPTPSPTVEPTPLDTAPPEPEPTVEPEVTAEPEPTETAPDDEPPDAAVQVLDGAGDATATEAVADMLSGLGYDVVAVNVAREQRETTTVLYTEGEEAAARDLAERDERFAAVEANEVFSTDIPIHVVVGADWEE